MEDVVPPGRKSRGRMSDLFVGVGELVRTQDPPFQVRDLRKFYVVTTIDPARVQPFLPAGLKVAPSNTGIMSINVIGDGSWGPHTSALHGVAVAGRDSPDGMEAVYYLGGYADCGSRELWDHYYLHSIREGSGSVSFEGGKVHGDSARPDGSGRLSMTAIALDPALAPVPQKVVQDSSYHYLGDAPDGTARIFSMYAYAKTVIPLRVEKIEMSPDLPAALLALAPVGIQWGVLIENMNVLLGAPRAVGKLGHSLHADHLKGGLLSIIDRHARPAVLVDAANRLRFVNRRAERDHGDWLKKGMTFNPGRVEYRTGLAEALMAVRGGGCVSTPVVIRPPSCGTSTGCPWVDLGG